MSTEDESETKPPDYEAAETKPTSKVARLIDEYGLGEAFGDELEARWTADEERMSLRTLADLFNERLLEVAISEARMTTLDGEVSNIYRLLRDDDVSSGKRVEARNRLQQQGIDVEALEKDFVTYQAIRSYLKEYRGAEYETQSDETGVDSVVETIQRLKSRVRSVTQNSLEQLRDKDVISLGDFRLFVDVDVLCEDCDTQYGVVELLKQGGCECRHEE